MRKMANTRTLLGCVASVLVLVAGAAQAEVNAVTPSTNEINRSNGWAHFDVIDVGPGYAELEFVSTRSFASCFEYRTDGDTSQVIGANYNPAITDGLYPFYCVNNSTRTETISASEYIEIRMVFGAEGDERFDWTRVDVIPLPTVSCEGFKAPADRDVRINRPNRVVPLRMQLVDADGAYVGDYELAPPVLQVAYSSGGDSAEFADELNYAGRGDEGNQFIFDGTYWAFNLGTRGLASGTYQLSVASGDASEYVVDPSCEVTVVIN